MTVQLGFDPHERKFVGNGGEEQDGLAVLLDAAMSIMKTRRQAEAVQQALGGISNLARH